MLNLEKWRDEKVKDLASAIARANHILADKIEDSAPVDSGELRDSVECSPVVVGPDRLSSSVTVDSDHALATEYGNVHVSPQPFFRPSIPKERAAMISEIHKSL